MWCGQLMPLKLRGGEMCSAFYYPSHYLIGRLHLLLPKLKVGEDLDFPRMDT